MFESITNLTSRHTKTKSRNWYIIQMLWPTCTDTAAVGEECVGPHRVPRNTPLASQPPLVYCSHVIASSHVALQSHSIACHCDPAVPRTPSHLILHKSISFSCSNIQCFIRVTSQGTTPVRCPNSLVHHLIALFHIPLLTILSGTWTCFYSFSLLAPARTYVEGQLYSVQLYHYIAYINRWHM